jgi:hypothetical protein
MFIPNKDTFSEVVDVMIYKYNSVDLKIWGILLRDEETKLITDDVIVVSANKLKLILNTYFRSDINRIEATSSENAHKEATSVYFLDQVFKNMANLGWVKVTLNTNAGYNRLVQIDEMKTIKFNVKTLRGTYRLFDRFNRHELGYVNRILHRAGLLKNPTTFKVFKVAEFLNQLDMYLSENNTSETFNLVNMIIQDLERYESDNPEVMIVTDRDLDI